MGGGSLKWGPPLVKRDLDYRFLPRIANPLKWGCGSDRVVIFGQVGLIKLVSCQKFSTSGCVFR